MQVHIIPSVLPHSRNSVCLLYLQISASAVHYGTYFWVGHHRFYAAFSDALWDALSELYSEHRRSDATTKWRIPHIVSDYMASRGRCRTQPLFPGSTGSLHTGSDPPGLEDRTRSLTDSLTHSVSCCRPARPRLPMINKEVNDNM